MSYLNEYADIQKNIDESRFSETAEYLVNHFSYVNDVARNQSETTMNKLSGVLTGILTRDEYQQTIVKYDASENVVLFKKVDDGPNSIILDISDSHAIRIPVGTSAERPTVIRDGYLRINTTTGSLEVFVNGQWAQSLNVLTAQSFIENYVDIYAADISRNLNDKINTDISNVIGGASESLDTLLELENYVTDLSDGRVATLLVDFIDLSGREDQHYMQLSNEIITLSSESVRDISDLSSITFHTISTEIVDLSSYTSSELLLEKSRLSIELSTEIKDLSSETMKDISDLSALTFNTLNTNITDLSNYTSSELSHKISDLSSATSSDITDLSNYTSAELSLEKNRLSVELSTEIRDLSSETGSDITDLSNYTSAELSLEKSRLSVELSTEILDLSSETSSDITDLSNYTSAELSLEKNRLSVELSNEISDLSSETARDITDLSNYTSAELSLEKSRLSIELSTEIRDLSSETTSDITDLSNYTSSELSLEKSRLSVELSTEIRDLSSETSSDITDLSNYTSTELSLEKNRLSVELSTEIRDLSSETARDITDLSNYTSAELSLEKSRLSAEVSTNISDLSALTFQTINSKITDLSSYTSSELNREISTERSITIRDLSDMSGDIHHIIDDLIGNAPYYLDTLEEIAFTLGDITEPSGGSLHTIIQKIYSVSQDIYDLSQTVAGVDSDSRNLNGRLTVNTYSVSEPAETVGLNIINGDISLNKTVLMYNKDNIIIGNTSTGDTIKGISSYASLPRGNVLIGSSTDISNSSIQFSTGLGYGIDLSGTGSTAIGYLAKTDGTNSTAIGYGSTAIGNNVIQLGNSQVEYVNTNGVVTMSSDARLKTNINTIPFALEKVESLRGVTYTRTDLPDKDRVYMGLIAQETEKVVPEVVNNGGEYKSIMYNSLMGLLVEAVKDLNVNHKVLDGRQTNLERDITSIKNVIREKLRQLNKIKNLVDVRDENSK